MPKTLDIKIEDQIETAKATLTLTNHFDWRPGHAPGLSFVCESFYPLADRFRENLRYLEEVPWNTADEKERLEEQRALAVALQDFALWILITGYEQEDAE